MNKLEKAFVLFDTYNQQDPTVLIWEGTSYPAEYFFALQVYNWVIKLAPDASEALLLASRSQHIGRWTSPRSSYPEGKAAYLQWRTDLAKFHASKATELMREAGYDGEIIEDVQRIILKKNLRTDPDVQTMENALCLVFLQFQFDDFIQKHDKKKVMRILQKSWTKMSQPGRDAALVMTFTEQGRSLLEKALQ
ncbi:MAG: DUF4202 domain-containing protein [Chitinophagaceae bacterium]